MLGRCPPLCSTGRHLPRARQCSRHWAYSSDQNHKAMPSWKGRSSEVDSPQRFQSSPRHLADELMSPGCQDHMASPWPPGPSPWAAVQLLAPQHSPNSWLSSSPLRPCPSQKLQRIPALGDHPAPVWFASGAVWVKKLSLSRRRDPRQSPAIAVPGPHTISSHRGFPHSHTQRACPAGEGEAGSWTRTMAPTQDLPALLWLTPGGLALRGTGNSSYHCWVPVGYQASQQPPSL